MLKINNYQAFNGLYRMILSRFGDELGNTIKGVKDIVTFENSDDAKSSMTVKLENGQELIYRVELRKSKDTE